ncbi:unnamed protein product [Hymenolepis diminuta]|uniref:Uncharacterized protein n=1 Tax=Hymenolepis diminuta TaxID=6216 RepID=A0A564ZE49_HYMDI|nr:unnamed protein product [Hymenolepis diminuta]
MTSGNLPPNTFLNGYMKCNEGVTDQRIEECLTSRPPATDFVLIEKLSPLSDSPDRPIQAIIVRRQMIKLEHSNSPRISQWQDGLIEDWRELRELFKIKGELLQSAGTRLPLLNRCELGFSESKSFYRFLTMKTPEFLRLTMSNLHFRYHQL